eukprot:2608950-Prymnesium_polylepis.1
MAESGHKFYAGFPTQEEARKHCFSAKHGAYRSLSCCSSSFKSYLLSDRSGIKTIDQSPRFGDGQWGCLPCTNKLNSKLRDASSPVKSSPVKRQKVVQLDENASPHNTGGGGAGSRAESSSQALAPMGRSTADLTAVRQELDRLDRECEGLRSDKHALESRLDAAIAQLEACKQALAEQRKTIDAQAGRLAERTPVAMLNALGELM